MLNRGNGLTGFGKRVPIIRHMIIKETFTCTVTAHISYAIVRQEMEERGLPLPVLEKTPDGWTLTYEEEDEDEG